CFGPKETPNTDSLAKWMRGVLHVKKPELLRAFRSYNAASEPFRKESQAHE
ncbi:MAG TPA: oxidoreductase, partial [Verrucomicrobiales bacterium]|nr:oxidoreductase [Verrucomicrobiales bacterium]